MQARSTILQGTLDLMVLKTLEQLGPLHGYGIARRIEQVGQDALIVNQGTIYLCLVRLVQKGCQQLKAETEHWERISGVIGRVLAPGERS